MNELTVYDYATKVHRVLMEPNLVGRIGLGPFMSILILTIVLMTMVSPWCIFIGLLLYLVARTLCKRDPYMLTILFDRIMQPNVWRRNS